MAKRKKRRSQKGYDARLVKDMRAKRIVFLRELSAMVSNAVGARIRCSFVGGEVVMPLPTKGRSGKVTRRVAHVAGYQEEPPEGHEPRKAADPPSDDVGF